MSLTIDPNNVKRAGGGNIKTVVWGETVVAGQLVYQDATTQQFFLADATDPGKPDNAARLGVALSGGVVGQTGSVAQGQNGKIELGAGVMSATDVLVSDGVTPGDMKTAGELAVGEYLVQVGYAETDSILVLVPVVTQVAKA